MNAIISVKKKKKYLQFEGQTKSKLGSPIARNILENVTFERITYFLEENKDSLDTCEYLIPTVVFEQIKKGKVTCKILKTDAVWHGMTYKEDKNELTSAIDEMIKNNIYPEKLWG